MRPKPIAPIFDTAARRAASSSSPASSSTLKRRHPPEPSPSASQPHTPAKRAKNSSRASHPAKSNNTTISSRLEAIAPLAERLRPKSIDDFVGQKHLTDILLNDAAAVESIIFWGPPGCGKTTLARLLAKRSDAVFKELSATSSGINDVRPLFDEAKNTLQLTGRRTIIFLDEVHRFTRSQQDIFLPFIEQGHVQLIGATTENPSFKLNGALLSRCRVFVLERLTDEEIIEIVTRAIRRTAEEVTSSASPSAQPPDSSQAMPDSSQSLPDSSQPLPSSQPIPDSSQPPDADTSANPPVFPTYPHITRPLLASLASLSGGDARSALSLLSLLLASMPRTPHTDLLATLKRSVATAYDRTGDDRYDLISALHKSVRGGQGSAALYWLARMLEGGEDPVYVARRMVVCASEDVGLADPRALPLAMATLTACQQLGMPECRINLAHCVAHLAEAPKSTRAYEAYARAADAARQDMTLPVPPGIRNAPTRLMKELGYGAGYKYNPDYAHPVTNEYLPQAMRAREGGAGFLRKEGDVEGKMWDSEALAEWEVRENGGRVWEGRMQRLTTMLEREEEQERESRAEGEEIAGLAPFL